MSTKKSLKRASVRVLCKFFVTTCKRILCTNSFANMRILLIDSLRARQRASPLNISRGIAMDSAWLGGPTADRSNRRKWRSIVPRSVLLWPAAKHATGIILLFKKWKQCFNTHFVAWRLPSTTVGKKMDITLARWVKSMEQQKRGSRLLSDYAGLTPWFVTSARKLASYVATLPSERWSRGWTPELLVIFFFLARWYGCYWASKLWLHLFHLKLFVIHVSRAHNKQCMQHPAFPAFFL